MLCYIAQRVKLVRRVKVFYVTYFKSLHLAMIVHTRFSSSSGNNYFSFTHLALERNCQSMSEFLTIQVCANPKNHGLETQVSKTQFDEEPYLKFFNSKSIYRDFFRH